MFIDPVPFGEAFDATDIETGEVLNTQQDTLNESSIQRDLFKKLSDNPYQKVETTKPCFASRHQRKQLLEGDWDIKGQHLLSLIARYTLLNPFRFLLIGLNFVLVTMVMGLIQVCFGSLYRQMNSWLFTENFTCPWLPQIWRYDIGGRIRRWQY